MLSEVSVEYGQSSTTSISLHTGGHSMRVVADHAPHASTVDLVGACHMLLSTSNVDIGRKLHSLKTAQSVARWELIEKARGPRQIRGV